MYILLIELKLYGTSTTHAGYIQRDKTQITTAAHNSDISKLAYEFLIVYLSEQTKNDSQPIHFNTSVCRRCDGCEKSPSHLEIQPLYILNLIMAQSKPVDVLVLDAAPLITQSASALQQYATKFFTTPGVYGELQDEHTRNQLLLWAEDLIVRQPKQVYVDKVSNFSKLTGDFSVLSLNDIHIIALAYELEYEKSGDKDLRKFPGEKLASDNQEEQRPRREYVRREEEEVEEEPEEDDDGFQTVKKKNRVSRKWRNKNRQNEQNREILNEETLKVEETAAPQSESNQEPVQPEGGKDEEDLEKSNLTEEYNEEDDDGDWITPENLQEEIIKDNNESVQDIQQQESIPVALSTGDFACQNVTMQIGLKLMNYMSGKQIRRVRNYMYRCHACFTMIPMPKSGQPKHFCPKCGGNTLLRCAVSVDTATGKVTPHLKRNFQWINKGQVYSLASPLSKNSQKQQGNKGYQHNKENRHKKLQDPVILREDQKEYAQALKDDAWQRKKNEKMLQEWIGGGSADNFISPFGSQQRHSGVKVGRGRGANAVKGKKK